MSIKITETTERWCCDQKKDLKPYRGKKVGDQNPFLFCIHCGQLWYVEYNEGHMEEFVVPAGEVLRSCFYSSLVP